MAPAVKAWTRSVSQSGGGVGILVLVIAVGLAGWTAGQHGGPRRDGRGGGGAGAGARTGQSSGFGAGSSPNAGAGYAGQGSHSAGGGAAGGFRGGFGRQYAASSPPPFDEDIPFNRRARTQASEADDSERPRPQPRSFSNASANWQKAREETRKREEERKKAEDEKKRQADEAKRKDEEDRKKRAEAEKAKWEQMRARERETREREAREKAARERMEKEKAAKAGTPTFGVGERTNPYGDATPKATANTASPRKPYEKPTAKSYVGTETEQSYRPYDKPPVPKHQSSHSSFVESEYSSDARSQSTAPTSPPPSHRGPYTTKDPDKVMIKGVYQFTDSFPKPLATLVAGEGGITDGLILKINTEGMFVDDDKTHTGLRQWDVKAWTMKGVEVFPPSILSKLSNPLKEYEQTASKNGLHIVRASIRDAENKRYVFVVPEKEEWKVAMGLQRLRQGPLVRSFGLTAMSAVEAGRLLGMLGWA